MQREVVVDERGREARPVAVTFDQVATPVTDPVNQDKHKLIPAEIELFTCRVDGLLDAFEPVLSFSRMANMQRQSELVRYVEVHGRKDPERPGTFIIDALEGDQLLRLHRRQLRTEVALDAVPRSFLVSLLTQFDAYLAALIRAMYAIVPQELNQSERALG